MARPKQAKTKEKLHLSISAEAKEMLDYIRTYKNASISELVQSAIEKEYERLTRLEKAQEITDSDLPFPE